MMWYRQNYLHVAQFQRIRAQQESLAPAEPELLSLKIPAFAFYEVMGRRLILLKISRTKVPKNETQIR